MKKKSGLEAAVSASVCRHERAVHSGRRRRWFWGLDFTVKMTVKLPELSGQIVLTVFVFRIPDSSHAHDDDDHHRE